MTRLHLIPGSSLHLISHWGNNCWWLKAEARVEVGAGAGAEDGGLRTGGAGAGGVSDTAGESLAGSNTIPWKPAIIWTWSGPGLDLVWTWYGPVLDLVCNMIMMGHQLHTHTHTHSHTLTASHTASHTAQKCLLTSHVHILASKQERGRDGEEKRQGEKERRRAERQ